MQKKILITLGTRPELIKLYPLIKLIKVSKNFSVKTCYTGQHRELVKMSSKIFNFSPDFSLNIMKESQSSLDIVENIFNKFKKICHKYNFESIIVQGDTTSAMSAALAAFYLKKNIIHIEAGLRTKNIYDPFPEEANRKIISQIASLHFSPTKLAKINLIKEGIENKRIFVVGNTVIDTLKTISNKYRIKNKNKNIILCTIHRSENINKNIDTIINSLLKIAEKNRDWKIIWPFHPNPIIKKKLQKIIGKQNNLLILNSLNYLDFTRILKESKLIISDSGGIQEEAAYLGKYIFIMRMSTERPEVLKKNGQILGFNEKIIIKKIESFIKKKKWNKIKPSNCFGRGNSAKKIINILENIK
jgi:UDP-N-acetylglucosamine 2-epimerase (non-hydrolysing)